MDYLRIMADIRQRIEPYAREGRQADYIPSLAEVDPDRFGMSITTIDGTTHSIGDDRVPFSIQSITKVFSLSCALSRYGEALWERVGKEPSGTAFNSLIQLEVEHGIPRNPFINAGAIVLADRLVSAMRDPEWEYLDFVRTLARNPAIGYNDEVARSEQSTGYLNAAIANLLKYHGRLDNDIERVLRFYFRQCSIEMTCRDLSRAFLPFADHRTPFRYGEVELTSSQVKRINALMQTCGFYDEAGEFSYRVGLPGKSGVGGGIAAVCPLRYSVAVWSPRLNAKGNSVMGMKALELLTTFTAESIF